MKRLKGHGNWIFSVAFNNKGSILASGSKDRKIIIWDAEEFEVIARLFADDWV